MGLKKVFFSTLAVCLLVGASGATLAKAKKGGATILETLERTNGSQALVAAIKFGEESNPEKGQYPCLVQIGPLLDDKKKKLLFFAPSNSAFEKFLDLPAGGFDGMSADAILLAFPGFRIFTTEKLSKEDVCAALQLLVVETKGAEKLTASKLLERGDITVADDVLLPIAIGDGGPSINYMAQITERDVFTVNGLIHYIDNVLVEPEAAPPDEEPLNPDTYCTEVLDCGVQVDECKSFVTACNLSSQDREDCAQGAALICFDIDLGNPGGPL